MNVDRARASFYPQAVSRFRECGPVLLPDGRFLMSGRGILDVTTGVTRSLAGGEPLAFSADSRLAVLARYDSDIEVSGEIVAVDPVTLELVWSIRLEPGPMPRDVRVAVAPQASMIAVQRHADLAMYDGAGRLLWTRPVDGGLAWQKSFLPERHSVALLMSVMVCLFDVETGEGGVCHDANKVQLPQAVVGWDEGLPIVVGNGNVVSPRGGRVMTLDSQSQLSYAGFATERVRWSKREPGPADAGPFFARYGSLFQVVGAALLVIVLLVAALRRFARYVS